ncbi:MAG: hypothetical protein HY697_03060 [Deltaproteobacteria bacterium]|nr:hypothetical protein [Deltaproteobacteria bacterium]
MGTPYDEDPLGAYVTHSVLLFDQKVDCMYLTFRAVELALSKTPQEALRLALDKRFHSRGILREGKVANYEDRFEYGEDMIESGKWGREITASLGDTVRILGSRGRGSSEILPIRGLREAMGGLRSGDILFFAKAVEQRAVGELVGHIGFARIEEIAGERAVFMIHASGVKKKGGQVKKTPLGDYLATAPFIGVRVTRLSESP